MMLTWEDRLSLWHYLPTRRNTATKLSATMTLCAPFAVLGYVIYYIISTSNLPQTINTDVGSAGTLSFPIALTCVSDTCYFRAQYLGTGSLDTACAGYVVAPTTAYTGGQLAHLTLCSTTDPIDGVYVYYKSSSCSSTDPVCFGSSYDNIIRVNGKQVNYPKTLSFGTVVMTATVYNNAPEGSFSTFAPLFIPAIVNQTGYPPNGPWYLTHIQLNPTIIIQTYQNSFSWNSIPSVIGGAASIVVTFCGGVAAFQFWYLWKRHEGKQGGLESPVAEMAGGTAAVGLGGPSSVTTVTVAAANAPSGPPAKVA